MRILFVHNRYRKAGGEDLAVELETALLREHGHEVEILLFGNEAIPETESKWKSLKKAIYNPESSAAVSAVIARFRPDLVHVHNLFFVASPSVLDAPHRAGIPVLMTLHNYRLICCNAILLRDGHPCELCTNDKLPLAGVRYRCYRGSLAASALVTAVTGVHKFKRTWQEKISVYLALTEFAKEKMDGSSLQVPAERLQVLPNFVHDLAQNGPVPPEEREPFYLFAGRLTIEKGIFPLVRAFREMPESILLVAGDGPDQARMQSEAADAPNIRFLGAVPRDELMGLMQRCRALLFPSIWYEGLPYVILESFCVGTPVLASRLGAMESVIEDGVNGFHFAPGDVADIVRVVKLFSLSGLPLYSGARNSWTMNYAPEHHYAALMKIYSGILRPN